MDAFTLAAVLTLDSKKFDSGLSSSEGKFKGLGSSIASGAKNIAKALAGAQIVKEVVNFGKEAVNAGMQFDKAMSQVAATMGTTTDSIQNLRDFALDMGAKTAFSASEAAEALNYMALAGYDADKSMQMLPTVLNLAAAGGIALASASDMVTDAQSALGLSFEETTVLVDQMAKTSSKTNTSVAQLGEAILTIGGTAKDIAGGTTELSAALGILADNGIKGAEGGTALRNILLSLEAPTDKAAAKMAELGLQVFNAEGNLRPLPEIFGDLNSQLSTMTAEERTNVLNDLFNKVDLKSVNALLGTNVERWEDLLVSIDNAKDAADEMAKTQLDNLAGDVTLFQSALESAKIAISDVVTPALRDMVQFGTDSLTRLTTAFKEGGLAGAVQEAGKIIGELGENVKTAFDNAVQKIGEIDWTQVGNDILNKISNVLKDITEWMKETFTAASDAIKGIDWADVGSSIWEFISGAFSSIASWFSETFGLGADAAENSIDWEGVGTAILDFVTTGLSAIGDLFYGLFSSAWETIQEIDWPAVGTAIKDKIVNTLKLVVDNFTEFFSNAANAINGIDWEGVGTWIREAIEGAVAAISGWFSELFNGTIAGVEGLDWSGLGDAIVNFIKAGLGAIDGLLTGLFGDEWTQLKTDAKDAWDNIQATAETAWNLLKDTATTIWENVKTTITTAIDTVGPILETAWNGIQSVAETVWNALKSTAETVWNAIQSFISDPIGTAQSLLDTAWSAIQSAAEAVWNALQSAAETVWAAIQGFIEDPIGTAQATLDTAWAAIQSAAETVWEALQSAAETVWNAIKSFIEDPIGTAQATLDTAWANIQSAAETVWNTLKSTAETVWESIKGFINDPIETVKGLLDTIWSDIESAATTVWNNIQSTVDSVISGIESVVNGFIDTITSAINKVGEWLGFNNKSVNTTSNHTENTYQHTYHVEHWTSEGGTSQSGKEGKFATAMFGGKILRGATVFGFNDNGPMVGGEAGPEAIVGVNSLDQMIANSVQKGLSGIVAGLAQALNGEQQPIYVVLDTGELVGAIVPKVDAELGRLNTWKSGGAA